MSAELVLEEGFEEEVVVEEGPGETTLRFGTASVQLDGRIALPERAGKLSALEVVRLVKTPNGLGLACEDAADALEKARAQGFVAPPDVTPESLRAAGEMAERIDQQVRDTEYILNVLKQGNLLLDAAAYEQLRKLNDMVKAQSKFAPELARSFSSLVRFFDKPGRPKKSEPKKTEA